MICAIFRVYLKRLFKRLWKSSKYFPVSSICHYVAASLDGLSSDENLYFLIIICGEELSKVYLCDFHFKVSFPYQSLLSIIYS